MLIIVLVGRFAHQEMSAVLPVTLDRYGPRAIITAPAASVLADFAVVTLMRSLLNRLPERCRSTRSPRTAGVGEARRVRQIDDADDRPIRSTRYPATSG